MSSQIKIEANVDPELVQGKSCLAKLGAVKYKWTIEHFQEFLDIGQTIISPSFQIEITHPFAHARSFHLEMEIPKKDSYTDRKVYPVFLVNEMGGDILMKIALLDLSPRQVGLYQPCVSVSLNANVVVQTSSNVRKQIMSVTPSNSPKEVAIAIGITLCNVSKQIVS
jgi:hypothetical protein